MKLLATFLLSAAVALLAGSGVQASENAISCSLDRATGVEFSGTCRVPCHVVSWAIGVHGPIPGRQCDFPDRTSPIGLKPVGSDRAWRGTMEGKFVEDPKLVMVEPGANGKAGVAKLPFGWFALTAFAEHDGKLTLEMDGNHLLPATQADFAIVRRAEELVATDKTWNRHDTRDCPSDATTWSLFCALIKATNEIEGSVHYRQPALQAVREVIDEVGVGRTDKHRLMDYNNHPDTTLADVHAALKMAADRLKTNFQ